MALVCSRCGKQVGMMGRLGFDKTNSRCGDCSRVVVGQLEGWRAAFNAACADGLLTQEEWAGLMQGLHPLGIHPQEALAFVRRDALNFLERSFAFAKADGHLDEAEEEHIRWLAGALNLAAVTPHIGHELSYLANIRNVRQGRLATIRPQMVLPADELCYLETAATYHKQGARAVTLQPGRLILTNKRLIFVAPAGGGEIPLNKIGNAHRHSNGVFLELTRKANNGFYEVPDAWTTAETILAVIRMNTRQLLATGDRDTRRIGRDVKVAVWQRDQGQCVQCGATEYLEFDHVIPHSKGGATSVNNLQLLCRRCNLAKGSTL